MTCYIIPGVSILLQFTAAAMALRLIRITGRQWAWSLIAAAIVLMGVRCCITFYHMIPGESHRPLDFPAELVELAVSGLLVSGIALIGPLLRSIRRSEQNAVDAEERFRTFSQTVAAAIFVHREGQLLFVNQASCELTGYTLAELMTMQLEQLIDPESATDVARQTDAITHSADNSDEREIRISRKDKAPCWAVLNSSVITFDGQQAVLETMNNITVRKDRETQLSRARKQAEQLSAFGNILDQSLNEIYIFDTDAMHFVHVNKGALINLGYSMQEMRQLTPLDLKPDHSLESFSDLIVPLQNGTSSNIEFNTRHRRKDGSLYPVNITLELSTLGDTRVFIAIILDLSSLKMAERQLQESEQRFRWAIESAPFPLIIHAEDGEVVTVNRSWTDLTGYSHADIPTIDAWTEKAYGDAKDSVRVRIKSLFTGTDSAGEGEYCIRTKDGGTVIWEFGSAPLGKLPDGRRLVISMASDVTSRKESDAEKEALRVQLLQSQKLKAVGELAAGIAHDFNNILTVVQGTAEFIAEQSEGPLSANAHTIMAASSRAAALVRQLLTLSKQVKARLEPTNILDVMDEVAAVTRNTFDRRIDFSVRSEPCPNVLVDSGQIYQVLLNLCVNARDAIEASQNEPRITMSAVPVRVDGQDTARNINATTGDYVCIRVSDTGTGIRPEQMEKIFDPFFTSKNVNEGTGLGLATSHAIIGQHRGWFDVDTKVGQGSTFAFYLPVAGTGLATTATQNGDAGTYQGTETVLIVDDEDAIRSIGRSCLERLGYTILEARDGKQAMEILADDDSRLISLVVLDLSLPILSGEEVLRQLRDDGDRRKVIVSSGYASVKVAEKLEALGVNGLISKPFALQEFQRTVRAVLDKTD